MKSITKVHCRHWRPSAWVDRSEDDAASLSCWRLVAALAVPLIRLQEFLRLIIDPTWVQLLVQSSFGLPLPLVQAALEKQSLSEVLFLVHLHHHECSAH